jgi:hypothetical protein
MSMIRPHKAFTARSNQVSRPRRCLPVAALRGRRARGNTSSTCSTRSRRTGGSERDTTGSKRGGRMPCSGTGAGRPLPVQSRIPERRRSWLTRSPRLQGANPTGTSRTPQRQNRLLKCPRKHTRGSYAALSIVVGTSVMQAVRTLIALTVGSCIQPHGGVGTVSRPHCFWCSVVTLVRSRARGFSSAALSSGKASE